MSSSEQLDANLYVRFFRAGSVIIEKSWWRFRFTGDLFWRLYRNETDGALLTVGDKAIPLRGGRLYVIPSHLPITLSCENPVNHFYIHFDIVGLPGIALRELFNAPFDEECDLEMAARIDQITRAFAPQWRDYDQPVGVAAQCRIKGIIHEALARYLHTIPPEQIERCWHLAEQVAPVLPAIDWIAANLASDISNPRLARTCHMSEGHFIRTFGACMGQTPAQYVMECRIKAALRRLLLTKQPIEQIAAETGFGRRHYFSRIFTRQIGQPPAAFRKARHG